MSASANAAPPTNLAKPQPSSSVAKSPSSQSYTDQIDWITCTAALLRATRRAIRWGDLINLISYLIQWILHIFTWDSGSLNISLSVTDWSVIQLRLLLIASPNLANLSKIAPSYIFIGFHMKILDSRARYQITHFQGTWRQLSRSLVGLSSSSCSSCSIPSYQDNGERRRMTRHMLDWIGLGWISGWGEVRSTLQC